MNNRSFVPFQFVVCLAIHLRNKNERGYFETSVNGDNKIEFTRAQVFRELQLDAIYRPIGFMDKTPGSAEYNPTCCYMTGMLLVLGLRNLLNKHPGLQIAVRCTNIWSRMGGGNSFNSFQRHLQRLAKPQSLVRHIFLPALVNTNHWVVFWIVSLHDTPVVLLIDSNNNNMRSIGSITGDSRTILNQVEECFPQIKSNFLPCLQQSENPRSYCGYYVLYHMETILDKIESHRQEFQQRLSELCQLTHSTKTNVKSKLKLLSTYLFQEDREPSHCLKALILERIRKELTKEIESRLDVPSEKK